MNTGWTVASTVAAALVVGVAAGLVSRGGRARLRRDRPCPVDVDPRELEMGIKVEMEHTEDPATAEVIACGHLSTAPGADGIPDYYTRLLKMERAAKRHQGALKARSGTPRR